MFIKFRNSYFQKTALSGCFQDQYYYPTQYLPAEYQLLKQYNKVQHMLNANNKP